MFDDRLEDRLRTALGRAGEELDLSVTPRELERRWALRRRARTNQRWTVVAAAIAVIVIGSIGAMLPTWLRGPAIEVAASPSPSATTASSSPSAVVVTSSPQMSPSGEPVSGIPIIRYIDYDWHAFEIAPDGTGRHRVPAFDANPETGVDPEVPFARDRALSPDGRFTATVNGETVVVHPIDAAGLARIFTLAGPDHGEQVRLRWSPDSRYLAIWETVGGTMATRWLWIVDVTSGETTAGPIESIGLVWSAWSSDSTSLASSGRDGLNLANAATGETRTFRMGSDVVGYVDLQWSPDGRWIIFMPFQAGNGDVHRLEADGSGDRKLALGTQARWSPDGSRIVYIRRSDGPAGAGTKFELWTMAPDGSDQHGLVVEPCPCNQPAWSPDGQWLTFVASHGAHDDIWVVTADGRDLRRLARDANLLAWVEP